MAVVALPDLAGAVVAYLRAVPEVAALTSTRISARRQDSWLDPATGKMRHAVLVQARRGGRGELPGGRQSQRVDLFCYAPDDRTADRLWAIVHPALCPPVGSGRENGFTAASTRVTQVIQEGGPLSLVDPDTSWDYVVATYDIEYSMEPAA